MRDGGEKKTRRETRRESAESVRLAAGKNDPGSGRFWRAFRTVGPYAMVVPAILWLLVFTVYPVINMIYLSFFDYDMLSEKVFTGIGNYIRLFTINLDFWEAVKNTAVYTLSVVILLILFGLLFALWFQKSTLLNKIAQRVMFFPYICATLSIAMIFQWLFDDEGLFNAVFGFFGIDPVRWLNDPRTALPSVIIMNVWHNMGYYAVILLSSLKSIPQEINEAADLDDTGPLRRFFRITLPMLSPQIFFLLVTITMGSFKVFDSVRILTNGGPGSSSMVLVQYIYRYAMAYLKFGYASAAGTFLFVVLMILTAVYFKVVGKRVFYQ